MFHIRLLSVVLIAGLVLPALVMSPAEMAAQGGDPGCEPEVGTVVTLDIESEALDQQRLYNIYLPPDWCHLNDLPLLVVLHGGKADHNEWVDDGHIDTVADELILAEQIEPVVILMPSVDRSFCLNTELGNYEDYLIDELIPAVEATFPTAAKREQRFIGGISMGGFCAVSLGLRYPDLFSAVGAYSPAIWRRIDKATGYVPSYLYGDDWEYFEERDPVSLIEANGWPEDGRLFVDVGDSDSIVSGAVENFLACLDTYEVTYEGKTGPGDHDWVFWGSRVADYLRFFVGVETVNGS